MAPEVHSSGEHPRARSCTRRYTLPAGTRPKTGTAPPSAAGDPTSGDLGPLVAWRQRRELRPPEPPARLGPVRPRGRWGEGSGRASPGDGEGAAAHHLPVMGRGPRPAASGVVGRGRGWGSPGGGEGPQPGSTHGQEASGPWPPGKGSGAWGRPPRAPSKTPAPPPAPESSPILIFTLWKTRSPSSSTAMLGLPGIRAPSPAEQQSPSVGAVPELCALPRARASAAPPPPAPPTRPLIGRGRGWGRGGSAHGPAQFPIVQGPQRGGSLTVPPTARPQLPIG